MIARAHDKTVHVCMRAQRHFIARAAFTCLNTLRRERGQREDLFNFSIMTIVDLLSRRSYIYSMMRLNRPVPIEIPHRRRPLLDYNGHDGSRVRLTGKGLKIYR